MNGEKKQNIAIRSAKEISFIAVFVALVTAAQLLLAAIPNVEIVSVLFIAYAYAFGVKRGLAAATAFSLLRQLIFGFFPSVLCLYLLYYNLLVTVFAFLAKLVKKPLSGLVWIVVTACVCAVFFTLTDNILTPLWYAYSPSAAKAYFVASLPFLLTHVISVGVSVALLFLPLERVFRLVKKLLESKEYHKKSK